MEVKLTYEGTPDFYRGNFDYEILVFLNYQQMKQSMTNLFPAGSNPQVPQTKG